MLFKSVNVDFFADSRVIIALIQTEMTNSDRQKPAAHFTGTFQSRSYQTAVMDVGPCCRYSQRDTLTVHMQVDFAALSLSVKRFALTAKAV